jgi:hypothetical protein
MPVDLYVGLKKSSVYNLLAEALLFLGSTATNCCLASFAGFRAQASQASSRLFNLLDNISAWPTFFFILLAVVLRITTFISIEIPSRFRIDAPTSRLRGLLGNISFSFDIFVSIQRGD